MEKARAEGNPESPGESKTDQGGGGNLKSFALKVGVVAVAIVFGLTWLADSVLPDGRQFAQGFRKAVAEPVTRLRLNGLISGNPRVNLEVSQVEEAKGNLAAAYDEMVVAVGILERGNAREELIEPYVARMNALKALMAVQQGQTRDSAGQQ